MSFQLVLVWRVISRSSCLGFEMGLAKIRIYKHQNVRVGKQREWREGLKNQAKPSHHISSRDKINGWAKNEPLLGDHPGMSAVPNHGM